MTKILVLRYDTDPVCSVQYIKISDAVMEAYEEGGDDFNGTIDRILDKRLGISPDECSWKELPSNWDRDCIESVSLMGEYKEI